MFEQLKNKLLLLLISLLFIDIFAIYMLSTNASSIPNHLQHKLNHDIDVIDQIQQNGIEFILYHDLATQQLEMAIYEPNALLSWRYNLSYAHQSTANAITNHCQTYQTSQFLVLWGFNEDLQAHSLKIQLNDEQFIEDLSQDEYFIKVYFYNNKLPDVIYCQFLDKNKQNISSTFFSNKLQ